jgi:hypothetical protein
MTTPGEEARQDDESAPEPVDDLAARVRRALSRGDSPEERLDQLLAARRREFEQQAASLQETVADLERREGLLRDSRASVERLLRVGTSDLDLREAELAQLTGDLTAREDQLRTEEADLARRRSELGAVELKRESVERRERTLAEKEQHLSAREAQVTEREPGSASGRDLAVQGTPPTLAFVPGSGYRLVEIEPGPLEPGGTMVVGDEEYRVARIGPSPLPGDGRRCAYLVRGARGPSSGGSS